MANSKALRRKSVVLGIGVDLESVSRFSKFKRSDPVLRKIFTSAEIAYCFAKAHPAQHLAARYAAKEAFIKAMTGISKKKLTSAEYTSIEVVNESTGRPRLTYYGSASLLGRVHISLSHTNSFAIANIIIT